MSEESRAEAAVLDPVGAVGPPDPQAVEAQQAAAPEPDAAPQDQQPVEAEARDAQGPAEATGAAPAEPKPEAPEPGADAGTGPGNQSSPLEALRAAVTADCEALSATARDTDLEFARTQLADLRARVSRIDPAGLDPRRGLSGLFDSAGKRLRRFRDQVVDDAPAISTAAVKLRDAGAALARRNDALNERFDALRARLAELDEALASLPAEAPLAEPQADDRPLSELVERLENETRAAARPGTDPLSLRAAAIPHLPLTRMIQNVDLRLSEAIGGAAEAVIGWRDRMLESLGADGKKMRPLRRVRPDPAALRQACTDLNGALDRLDAAIGTARTRRAEILARLDRALEIVRQA